MAVRGISAKGVAAGNIIGGGTNFGGAGNCVYGCYVSGGLTNVVQTGNINTGVTSWTGQTYPV